MMHASPAPDEQEFWLFIQDAPLPAAEELQESMFRLDGCFRLNLSGAPENAPDHVLEGEYLDEAGNPSWTYSGSWKRTTRARRSKGTARPSGR